MVPVGSPSGVVSIMFVFEGPSNKFLRVFIEGLVNYISALFVPLRKWMLLLINH